MVERWIQDNVFMSSQATGGGEKASQRFNSIIIKIK